MQFSPILFAAAMLLSGVMADCPSECVKAVNACCKKHNGKACHDLDTCGANKMANACSQQRSACNAYCGSSNAIHNCLASLRY